MTTTLCRRERDQCVSYNLLGHWYDLLSISLHGVS